MPTFSCASEKNIPKHFDRRPNDDDKYSHEDLNKLSRLVDNLTQTTFSSNLQNFIRNLDSAAQLVSGSVVSPALLRDFLSCHAWIVQFEESYIALMKRVNENAYSNFLNHVRVARKNTKDSEKISQLALISFQLYQYHDLRIKPLLKARKIIDQLSWVDSRNIAPATRKKQIALFLLCSNHPINSPKIDDLRLIRTIAGQWHYLWKAYVACIKNSANSIDAIDTINLFISRLLIEFANERNFFQSLSWIVENYWCSRTNGDLLLDQINKALRFSQQASIPLIESVSQLGKLVFSLEYQSLLMRYYSRGLRADHLLITRYDRNSVRLYSSILTDLFSLSEEIINPDALFQILCHVPLYEWINYTADLLSGSLFLAFALTENWSECLSFLQLSLSPKPCFLSVTGPAGVQPIHLFAKAGHLELVTLAVAQGASLMMPTQDNKTPVILAAENEHWEVVSKIAELHAADSTDSEQYGLALYLAAQAKKWNVCELLIRRNALLHFAPYDILRSFCKSGQSALIQLSFHHEHNQLYFINSLSMTHQDAMPIVLAAKNDHWETVLILCGYDPDDAHPRPIYQYLLNLAISCTRFSFVNNMLTRHPQHFLSLGISDQFVCAVVLQKYQDAIALIIQYKEKCFDSLSSRTIATHSDFTDFFAKKCDFRAVELELNLVSQLIAFGVPIDKFSDAAKEKLLMCDDWFSLPLITLYKIVIAKIPSDILQRSMPPIPMHYITTDCTIKINQLNNLNFIEFTRWLCLLKNYLKINQQIALIKIITTMINQCHDVLACGIDHLYLNSLYQRLNSAPSPITLFSRENRPNLTEALKAFYPHICDLDLMAQLLKQYNDVFLTLRLQDVRFQILFYFACFLSRANYPRNLFLPDVTAEIGISLSRCEDHDVDDLIFVGRSLRDAKIIVVSEFLKVFNQSHNFIDPVTREPIDEQTISVLLEHPKIRAAVVAAHEYEKTAVLGFASCRLIVTDVINRLAELGRILWDASTDSGREIFDEAAANRAVNQFREYSEKLPSVIVNALHDPCLCFYLNSRNALTTYSQLFSQLTYWGCSGQLGAAVREWAGEFRKTNERIISEIHVTTKLSSHIEQMTSMPMNTMYVTQVSSLDCRMSGKGFVKALLLEQERLVSQLRY